MGFIQVCNACEAIRLYLKVSSMSLFCVLSAIKDYPTVLAYVFQIS